MTIRSMPSNNAFLKNYDQVFGKKCSICGCKRIVQDDGKFGECSNPECLDPVFDLYAEITDAKDRR